MSRIFITGSADGLGQLTAKLLIAKGHHVVLHARNSSRAQQAMDKNPQAETVLTGDLNNTDETKTLAQEANNLGTFDAVIHNAGVYQTSSEEIFNVNVLAPYILTSLMHRPRRLIYLSSGMHLSGHFNTVHFTSGKNRITYSDSKLYVLMLAKAVARKWIEVYSNTVNPGWVPTRMGGRGAPDDLQKGCETQAWLAASEDAHAQVSGRYFFHQKESRHNPEADDVVFQEQLIENCTRLTGVSLK